SAPVGGLSTPRSPPVRGRRQRYRSRSRHVVVRRGRPGRRTGRHDGCGDGRVARGHDGDMAAVEEFDLAVEPAVSRLRARRRGPAGRVWSVGDTWSRWPTTASTAWTP